MKLHALDIPDAPADLAPWLERQLTGLHLAELVAELSAVHGTRRTPERDLDDVLGGQLPRVLNEGLSVLSPEVLRELLQQPGDLLALQERLLIEGGPYWETVEAASNALQDNVALGWQKLSRALEQESVSAPLVPRLVQPDRSKTSEPMRIRQRSWIVTAVATAAALLLGFFLGDRFETQPQQVASGWGWQRPDAFKPGGTQAEYLNHLADSAEQWFRKRPDTPVALAKRISEFRDGCTALLLAEHRPLAAETKRWLRERCSVWAGKLDAHRNGLEAGQDVNTIRDAADDTIKKLIQALRTKATEAVS